MGIKSRIRYYSTRTCSKSLGIILQKLYFTKHSCRNNQLSQGNFNTSKSVGNFKKPCLAPQIHDDELTRYLSSFTNNEHEIANPIDWWIEAGEQYFRRSILTLDAFSVLPIFAKCERVFSSYMSHVLIVPYRGLAVICAGIVELFPFAFS